MITRGELQYIDLDKLEARLLSKSSRSGECVVWTGAKNEDGYGIMDQAMVQRARKASELRGGLSALSRETGFKYGTLWRAARGPWGEDHYHR